MYSSSCKAPGRFSELSSEPYIISLVLVRRCMETLLSFDWGQWSSFDSVKINFIISTCCVVWCNSWFYDMHLRSFFLTYFLYAHVPTCLVWLRPHVTKSFACLRAHLPTCLACLYAYVPTRFACFSRSRTNVLCVLLSSRINVPWVSTCLACLCTRVSAWLAKSCA